MIKRKAKKIKGRNLIGTVILYLLIIIFFGIVSAFSWTSYANQYEIDAIMDKNVRVMATLTDIRWGSGAELGTGFWYTWYEFTDEDGTFYDGKYSRYNKNKEDEAEAQIGKQVKIYIDGQGTSFPLRKRPNFTYYLVVAIILTIIAVGAVAFIIVKEVLLAKDRKLLKKIRSY